MVQSFLHILPIRDNQEDAVAGIKNDYGWLRDPEIYNGKEIKVKEMRDLIVFAQKKPIDDIDINIVVLNAELISPSVANTMLKIMEEPPPYLSFHLLTNNPHRVLPTIVSRCHRVHRQGEPEVDNVSGPCQKIFEELVTIKEIVKDDHLKEFLLKHEHEAIAKGKWQEAREVDRVLNLYGTTNVSTSIALERIAINQKADIDTPEK